MIHTNNHPIHHVSKPDMSRKFIRLLWAHRHSEGVREIIRNHIRLIRKWATV